MDGLSVGNTISVPFSRVIFTFHLLIELCFVVFFFQKTKMFRLSVVVGEADGRMDTTCSSSCSSPIKFYSVVINPMSLLSSVEASPAWFKTSIPKTPNVAFSRGSCFLCVCPTQTVFPVFCFFSCFSRIETCHEREFKSKKSLTTIFVTFDNGFHQSLLRCVHLVRQLFVRNFAPHWVHAFLPKLSNVSNSRNSPVQQCTKKKKQRIDIIFPSVWKETWWQKQLSKPWREKTFGLAVCHIQTGDVLSKNLQDLRALQRAIYNGQRMLNNALMWKGHCSKSSKKANSHNFQWKQVCINDEAVLLWVGGDGTRRQHDSVSQFHTSPKTVKCSAFSRKSSSGTPPFSSFQLKHHNTRSFVWNIILTV